MKHKSTMVELVTELEAITPRTPQIEFMIEEAKAGEYHDYKNEKYVCGKVAAHALLQKAGLMDLAARVADGEFDEEADEVDQANLRKDLLSSGASEKLLEVFGLQQKH
jgi:hypothetical protein